MSTLANITSLNLSLQTGGAALAVNAVKSVAKPERTVYVFGTADDVAPNFTTVDGALTYAESLLPGLSERVVVRMFAKTDGTAYTLADSDLGLTWEDWADSGIIIVSDFVRLNTATTIPDFLPAGQQVWYIDPNGVETLWVGREDGSAWPAVGYKEYVALVTQTGTSAPVATVLSNTLGTVTYGYGNVGEYTINYPTSTVPYPKKQERTIISNSDAFFADIYSNGATQTVVNSFEGESLSNGILAEFLITLRLYP
jgi:hypothetical protein